MASLESIVGYRELTAQQSQAVLNTLQKVLDSHHFSKSKRYPALLEFAVRNTLEGKLDKLKERDIGAEVFSRPFDYDTTVDPVVRIAAVEVRKRLELYFQENPESPVRIDLPLGSYRAEFHFRNQPEEVSAPQAPPIAKEEILEVAHGSASTKPAKPWRTYLRLSWTGGALAIALLFLVAAMSLWHYQQAREGLDLWKPLLHNGTSALVVIGKGRDSSLEAAVSAATNTPVPVADVNNLNNLIPVDSAIAVAKICGFLQKYQSDCRIMIAPTTDLEDLRNQPVVFVGAYDNQWTQRVLAPLRYQFQFDTLSPNAPYLRRMIVDRQHGKTPSSWVRLLPNTSGRENALEYAMIARFHSDLTDSNVIVIAGLGPLGTRGAEEFAISSNRMSEILTAAPKGWGGLNFEAVLQIDVIQRKPGHAKVVAVQYW